MRIAVLGPQLFKRIFRGLAMGREVQNKLSSLTTQQLPPCTVNSVGEALLPPPEAPNGLPESLRGRSIVLLHGFSELLPDPSFCLCDRAGCSTLGLSVPLGCLRSPTSQEGQVGLLLQLNGIPYFRAPPPGSGIASATGTRDFTATAANGRIDNGGGEHGPLGLHVSHLPRDLGEAHPEVGVEDPTDRRIHQTFPTDPHLTFGPASSAPLFTRVSETRGRRSGDTTTKSIIDLRLRVSWCHVH
ncbi:uncharacterized protein LOC114478456 [Gouania willdenowi]|uniref:uncharacterized protein LOC114478456 n=1 Tax=Gouania willdenowi TaxID=441366 RepID=UPI0010546150|nr:uncharacterized protein LOC114478456 [Gouania willdenowi]